MVDRDLWNDLFDIEYRRLIEYELSHSGHKSILEVKILRKKIKVKKWIFKRSKEVRIIQFVVDEPLFVLENLLGLDIRSLHSIRNNIDEDGEALEIVNKEGEAVV